MSLRKRLRPRLWPLYGLTLLALWWASPSPLSIAIGLVPIVIGEGLRLWATGHLHKTESLTVTGPYAYLRHPLYAGTLLICGGFLFMANSLWTLALFGVFALGYFGYYMPYKDRIESARLEAHFGDAFRRYAVAVPRLIPRLHPYVPLAAEQPPAVHWRITRFDDNNELGVAASVAVGVLAMVVRWLIG